RHVFGMVSVYHEDSFLQAQTPGSHDVLVFEKHKETTGNSGDIAHFGFRLKSADEIHGAAERVVEAGGTLVDLMATTS
ncbi:MAG: hypothetical protein ABJB66_07300, partial [Gemmatimonadaceae bacterium]